jgi:hypothetical protein
LKAFRVALARTLFQTGLWNLGGLVLRDGDVLFLKSGEAMVFRHDGRVETRKGMRSNRRRASAPSESYSGVIVRLVR